MNRPGRAPSQRQLRVGEALRHALAWTLEKGAIRDPDLAVPITVTEVRMSPDLKHATAFVMPLGGQNAPAVLAGLKRVRGYLRHAVADRVPLKFLPEFSFELDHSFEEGDRIERLLKSPAVARDLESDPGDEEPSDGA